MGVGEREAQGAGARREEPDPPERPGAFRLYVMGRKRQTPKTDSGISKIFSMLRSRVAS